MESYLVIKSKSLPVVGSMVSRNIQQMRDISHDAGLMLLAFEAALSGLRVEIASDKQKLKTFEKYASDKKLRLQPVRKSLCPRETPLAAQCEYDCNNTADGCRSRSIANKGLDCDTIPMCTYADSREAHEKVESACSHVQTLAVIFREFTNAGILLEHCIEKIQIEIQTYQTLLQAQEHKCCLDAETPAFLTSESCTYTKLGKFTAHPYRPQHFESLAICSVGGLNSIVSSDKSDACSPEAPGSFDRTMLLTANRDYPKGGVTLPGIGSTDGTDGTHRTRCSRPIECIDLHVSLDKSHVTRTSLLASSRSASVPPPKGDKSHVTRTSLLASSRSASAPPAKGVRYAKKSYGRGRRGVGTKEACKLEAWRASTTPFTQERQEACSTTSHKTNRSSQMQFLEHVQTDINAVFVDLKTEMVQPDPLHHALKSEIRQDTSTHGLAKIHKPNPNEPGHSPEKRCGTRKRNSCFEMKISSHLEKERHLVHSRDDERKALIERFILQDSIIICHSLPVSPPTSPPFPISRSVSLAWRRFSFLHMFRCMCCFNTPHVPTPEAGVDL